MVIMKALFSGWIFLSGVSQAAIITFDLRNLGEPVNNRFDLSVDGLRLSLSSYKPGNAKLVSTLSGFGIDSGYAGEAPGFINGRLATGQGAESLFFMFSHDVVIRSVILVWNSSGVIPVIDPKSVVSQATVLGNGLTILPDLEVGRTSANMFYHSSQGTFPANGGFAIQSITVDTIPETSSVLCVCLGTVLSSIRRRR
jgi:hypothetical protein